jgi:undecaprenyl diphosphate synthase
MDGNGRWAKKRFCRYTAGHKQGVDALSDCVNFTCARRPRADGVAFSEN